MSANFISVESIRKQLLQNREVQAKAYAEVRFLTDDIHEKMVEEFNEHPVTRELERAAHGEDVGNISHTLNGYEGNLYGFIGFNAGENPIEPVRDVLKKVNLDNQPRISEGRITFTYHFPTLKEVENAGPMPSRWDSGSWVAKIQRGISGFSSFMARLGAGVSEMGIQATNKKTGQPVQLRQGTFTKVPYMTQILLKFKERLFLKARRL